MKTLRDLPSLPSSSWDGHVRDFQSDRGGFFLRVQRELGDMGRIRFFNLDIVVLSSPELIHELLVEKARSFEKSIGIRLAFYPFAGTGLFTSEGELWRRQRKLMSPLFHPPVVRGYGESMGGVISKYLDTWKDGEIIDAGHEMTHIAMGVAGKVLFDTDTTDEADDLGAAIRVMFDYFGEQGGSLSLFVRASLLDILLKAGEMPGVLGRSRNALIDLLYKPFSWPPSKQREVVRAIETLDNKIQRMIDERRRASSQKADLLSRLLEARDEDDGSVMTDKQVRDEALTLFVAGHETTATGMTWALHLLSRHPEAYRRFQEEIAALGGKKPTVEDTGRLSYSLRVFKEALRLYPPAFVMDRVATTDVPIGGVLIPANTLLFVSPYALHRRADLWPDPERFDPDRFTPEAEAGRPRLAYLPFGAGPRVCIGAGFAQLEAQLILAELGQRFDFEAVDRAPVAPSFASTLRPESPVRLSLKARPHRTAAESVLAD